MSVKSSFDLLVGLIVVCVWIVGIVRKSSQYKKQSFGSSEEKQAIDFIESIKRRNEAALRAKEEKFFKENDDYAAAGLDIDGSENEDEVFQGEAEEVRRLVGDNPAPASAGYSAVSEPVLVEQKNQQRINPADFSLEELRRGIIISEILAPPGGKS